MANVWMTSANARLKFSIRILSKQISCAPYVVVITFITAVRCRVSSSRLNYGSIQSSAIRARLPQKNDLKKPEPTLCQISVSVPLLYCCGISHHEIWMEHGNINGEGTTMTGRYQITVQTVPKMPSNNRFHNLSRSIHTEFTARPINFGLSSQVAKTVHFSAILD